MKQSAPNRLTGEFRPNRSYTRFSAKPGISKGIAVLLLDLVSTSHHQPVNEMHSNSIHRELCLAAALFVAALAPLSITNADDAATLIESVKAVEAFGEGNVAAGAAVEALSDRGADVLPEILAAFDDANPLAENWLRGAFESIAARTLEAGDPLPNDLLEAFVVDRGQYHRARRLAYEWLLKADPTAADRLVPQMIDDPGTELRRDAIARLIDRAQQLEGPPAIEVYHEALANAVDGDQVQTIAVALGDAGEEVDLVAQFGLMMEWQVIGPFNNKDLVGFDTTYPPEEELDLEAAYEGQLGEVHWEPLVGDSPRGLYEPVEVGVFDLAKLTAPHKGACSYATTIVTADQAQSVEFRIATPNAWKLWVNGELLFGHEEYHRGMRFDQYSVRGELREGENSILLKICQNEQEDSWAQDWEFQFRICDLAGQPLDLASNDETVSLR